MMKRHVAAIGTGLAVVAVTLGVSWCYQRSKHSFDRCYARVTWGMTLAEVRDVMGFDEDSPDKRPTITGEFERSWSFADGGRITVVFDPNGRSVGKEIAPSDCGNTPLMEKYSNK